MGSQNNDSESSLMDKLVSLSKRRGFIFQSSEIYGGINGFWDYDPLGVELKRNVKEAWWEDNVKKRDDMVGLDCALIMNPKVWEASGHLGGFSDPMSTCHLCKKHFRSDQLEELILDSDWVKAVAPESSSLTDTEVEIDVRALRKWAQKKAKKAAPGLALVTDTDGTLKKLEAAGATRPLGEFVKLLGAGEVGPNVPCPACGGELTEPRQFNLMFKTYVGAMEDNASVAYLRPETAQGIFANYKNVLDTSRLKLPFGIAQIGKSFRNEINPRNYTFRSREFEQMEIEFFCHPGEADKWYTYWRDRRYQWYVDHGLSSDRLHLRDHAEDELAHYAKGCADVEFDFPFGLAELEGIANRADYDLSQHQKHSGKDLTYFDDESRERFTPYVIEPSGGVDRATLAFLCEAYTEDAQPDDKGNMKPRTVMKFHPRLAPTKLAVFPLVKKDGMPEVARGIYDAAQKKGLACFYDEKGAVGRRYRRQDEAGTPYCITVDGETLEKQTVTIRDRDSLKQERVAVDQVVQWVEERV